MVMIDPPSDCPPMLVLKADGEEIEYTGLSAKHAVYSIVWGVQPAEEAQLANCVKIINKTHDQLIKWRSELSRIQKLDVARECLALEEYNASGEREEAKKIRDDLIEEKAQFIASTLKQHPR